MRKRNLKLGVGWQGGEGRRRSGGMEEDFFAQRGGKKGKGEKGLAKKELTAGFWKASKLEDKL